MEWVREAEAKLTCMGQPEEGQRCAITSMIELLATKTVGSEETMERAQGGNEGACDLGSSLERRDNLARAMYREQARVNIKFLNVVNVAGIGEIRRLCENGQVYDALHSAELLCREGLFVRRDDLYWLLQACTRSKDLVAARQIQSLMCSSGLYSASVLADHLIRLFALCGSLPDAKDAFAKVLIPTVFTWNAIISACTQLWEPYSGLLYYGDMLCKDVMPSRVTFLTVLKACGSLSSLNCVRQAHNDIVSKDFDADVILCNLLIDTYARCGSLHESCCVFDMLQPRRDVISWSSMILGYAQHGHGIIALDLYEEMQEEGIQPENTTYAAVLKACGAIGAIDEGRRIHEHISIYGLLTDVVLGGTLIDMYIKCGNVKEARLVFNSLPSCDEVSWSTMISGYVQHGYGSPALDLFEDMQRKNLKADRATYLCVLKACALVGALQEGRLAHEQLTEEHLDLDVAIKNALVDMYARCVSIDDACQIFNTLSDPDLASWGAMVSGYAACGQGMQVEHSFRRMQRQGLVPDSMLFMSILSACSHAVLLEEGCHYFKCMIESCNDALSMEHYNCMVDLLSRAGCLDEAQTLLLSSPTQPSAIGWTSFCTWSKLYKSNHESRSLHHASGGQSAT
ncbi:hypothetical protein L7F22_055211 [Adiantum nelumboides]|nr:hypothetical protein [Adiantum nelumboides]